jgi:DNA-binding XRE family transcriptional regulator
VRIHGSHFRPEVKVFLAGRPITPVIYQPNEGSTEVIEITTPTGFLGEIDVRVQSADDAERFATTKLLFVDSLPRPYAPHVDRQKFKQRRWDELKLNQTQLEELVGVNQSKISQFERGKWNPPDDFIERLAHALGRTVADFRKDAPGAGE